MYTRLHSFLNKNNILFKNQFGFRPGHSTSHALLNVLDEVYDRLDQGKFALGIYLDIQKAFDCINHDILLDKLQTYGIRGVAWRWFQNYLRNRKQFVSVNNCESSVQNISYGVPQGSVLGPLLFLIYINDIQQATGQSFLNLFADDTSMFLFDRSVVNLFDKSNKVLESTNNWFKANKLKLSLDKCIYTVFKLAPNKISFSNYDLCLNGVKLNRVKITKYLGVIIDEDLNWQEHILYVKNKLIKFCSIFYKLRLKIPHHVLKKFVLCTGLSSPCLLCGNLCQYISKIFRPTNQAQ